MNFHNAVRDTSVTNADKLLDSLNRSAERLQTLWFTFLFLMLYVSISVSTTTHRMLLLNEGMPLPFVNIKVPLLPFYIITPVIFSVIHLYVILNLFMLKWTADSYNLSVTQSFIGQARQNAHRSRLENSIFLQILAGNEVHKTKYRFLIFVSIINVTIVIFPFVLLMLIEIMFLPYHDFYITWFHRLILLTDGIFSFVYVLHFYKSNKFEGKFYFVAIPSSVFIVTGVYLSIFDIRWAGEPWLCGSRDELVSREILFGLFPNRISVFGDTIVGNSRLKDLESDRVSSYGVRNVPSFDFRYRNFDGAIFSWADLREVSFQHSSLYRAEFSNSLIQDADFTDAQALHCIFIGARAANAIFERANLSQSVFSDADLSQAKFDSAEIHGGGFALANATGTWFTNAKLDGALFSETKIESTTFSRSNLAGAIFQKVKGSGPFFVGAKAVSIVFSDSSIPFANFSYADLHNGRFTNTELQGSSFATTQLQGAHFGDINLDAAIFSNSMVFNAELSNCSCINTLAKSLDYKTVFKIAGNGDLTPETMAKWMDDVAPSGIAFIIAVKVMEAITQNLLTVEPIILTRRSDRWRSMEDQYSSTDDADTKRSEMMAALMKSLICDTDSNHEFSKSILYSGQGSRSILESLGETEFNLVKKKLLSSKADPSSCEGTRFYNEENWKILKQQEQK